MEILSGVFEGKTTGTPISLMVWNENQRSGDYGDIASYYRPGHADYTFDMKYGFRDYRGGGIPPALHGRLVLITDTYVYSSLISLFLRAASQMDLSANPSGSLP